MENVYSFQKGYFIMRSDKYKKKVANEEANVTPVTENSTAEAPSEAKETKKKKKKKEKKKKSVGKIIFRLFLVFLVLAIAGGVAVGSYVYKIIKSADAINPDDIYTILTESTVIYDDAGKKIDTVYQDSDRTIVTYEQIPEDLINAIVALEDKTFWNHHGFNYIRILGAIKEAVFSGGEVSGTSTITQQLARNIFLRDSRFDHSYERKIIEAYYTRILENELTKEQIITAYLNTVDFGYGCSGVQAASRSYFSKNVKKLTLAECAALAACPQLPTTYALVKMVPKDEVTKKDKVLKEVRTGAYIVNDLSKDRRELCLDLMLEQGYITQEKHDKAMKKSLKKMLNPKFDTSNEKAHYFEDYVIDEVISDLMEKYDWDYSAAAAKVYNGGLKIYSTLNSSAQKVITNEFNDDSNFPSVYTSVDGDGNILNSWGGVSLYDYDDFFDSKGNFTLYEDEIAKRKDGGLVIKTGHRLNIYETEVNGETDYSIEFKNMYVYENGELYAIGGGYINIPQQYKSLNSKGNLVISAEFFENPDYDKFFKFKKNGNVVIPQSSYTLNQQVIEPQAAMTIIENKTGHIKAMVGGRKTSGRMLYNRAINPRQPGSSIKPLGVYSAALQQGYEEVNAGQKHYFVDNKIDKQGAKYYGDYLTTKSIVVDEKTTIEGRVWPKNAGPGYSGIQTMRSAIQLSINTCAVKILTQVGVDYAAKLVEKYGISTLDLEGEINDVNLAALGLGGMSNGVTTLDMASAYTTFPNNGKRYETTSYTKVVDSKGEVLIDKGKKGEAVRVLNAGVAWIMADMLKSVVYGGTGGGAAISGCTVGGKTGTTDDQCDIWFDGFTPSYSASLWIGNDQNFELTSMSSYAAALWGRIMNQIPECKEGSYKSAPDNVIYTAGDYFISGTQSGLVDKDKLYKKYKVCAETGYLATPDCPKTKEVKYSIFDVDDDDDKDSKDSKNKVPKYYCNHHNKDTKKYPIDPTKKLIVDKPKEDPKKDDDKTPSDDDNKKPSGDSDIDKPTPAPTPEPEPDPEPEPEPDPEPEPEPEPDPEEMPED